MNLYFESYHIISDTFAFSRNIFFSLVLGRNSYFVGRAATNSRNADSAAIHQHRPKLNSGCPFFHRFLRETLAKMTPDSLIFVAKATRMHGP